METNTRGVKKDLITHTEFAVSAADKGKLIKEL